MPKKKKKKSWNHAEYVYWHFVVAKRITLDRQNLVVANFDLTSATVQIIFK